MLPPETVQIAGLRLLFRRSWTGVDVTDAGTGAWVANVYGFGMTSGPFLRHSYRYRAQLGAGPVDPHGAEARAAVRHQAIRIY